MAIPDTSQRTVRSLPQPLQRLGLPRLHRIPHLPAWTQKIPEQSLRLHMTQGLCWTPLCEKLNTENRHTQHIHRPTIHTQSNLATTQVGIGTGDTTGWFGIHHTRTRQHCTHGPHCTHRYSAKPRCEPHYHGVRYRGHCYHRYS